jgi:hypothetical protein
MAWNGYIKSPLSWDSLAILSDVNRKSIELNAAFLEALEPSLWIELVTEYDADHFCEYLKLRQATVKLFLSDMFSEFEKIWRRDELNHTRGFARVYSVLYSVSEEELFDRLSNRRSNFSAIEPLLVDEFAICVVLAYDEIATTKSYQYDMVHRYPKFRNQALIDWIRLVARDEAWHFENALNIIKTNHLHRIPEVPSILDQLMDFDVSGKEYQATFVLDHSANNYDSEFLDSCRTLILRRLGFVPK